MSRDDILHAIAAASKAQEEWAKTPLKDRSHLLKKLFSLMEENSEHLAKIMTYESVHFEIFYHFLSRKFLRM